MLIATGELLSSTVVTLAVSLVATVLLYVPRARGLFPQRPVWESRLIKELLIICLPLCLASFISMYLASAPRFSIKHYLDSTQQGYFTILFMPAMAINLLSIMVFRHVNPLTVVIARLTALMAAVLGLLVGISAEACSLAVLDLLPLSGLARMLGLSSLSASQWSLAVLCACSGVVLFAILYAAVGLFVREPAQLQYAQFPVSLVLVLVFVLSYIAVLNPSSSLATAAALFPLSAPMVESGRIIADQSTPLEPWGAALGALILLGIVAAVIARIVVPRTVGRYSTTAASRRPRPHHRH